MLVCFCFFQSRLLYSLDILILVEMFLRRISEGNPLIMFFIGICWKLPPVVLLFFFLKVNPGFLVCFLRGVGP